MAWLIGSKEEFSSGSGCSTLAVGLVALLIWDGRGIFAQDELVAKFPPLQSL